MRIKRQTIKIKNPQKIQHFSLGWNLLLLFRHTKAHRFMSTSTSFAWFWLVWICVSAKAFSAKLKHLSDILVNSQISDAKIRNGQRRNEKRCVVEPRSGKVKKPNGFENKHTCADVDRMAVVCSFNIFVFFVCQKNDKDSCFT